MIQLISIFWLVVGATLLTIQSRVAISPVPWIALTLMLHASRSMPAGRGAAFVWLALFVTGTILLRQIIPIPGAAYYVVTALTALGLTVPFLIDRLASG